MLDELLRRELKAIIAEVVAEQIVPIIERLNVPAFEKEWLTTGEAVRDYKVSARKLLIMRKETLELRKDKEWQFKNGIYIYHRKALERECTRRPAKDNVRNIRAA